jgi:hypothetical protein
LFFKAAFKSEGGGIDGAEGGFLDVAISDASTRKKTAVFFTRPVALRLHLKKPTATGFFTLAASRWRMIIGDSPSPKFTYIGKKISRRA